MQTYNYPNLFAPTTVMNANLNSPAMQLLNMVGFCIQVVFTGTPTGTFKLQGSNDSVVTSPSYVGGTNSSNFIPTNWTDVADSSQAVSAAGSIVWNADSQYYNYVRVVYTDGSSGASTAVLTDSTFNGKGV
jgi:hypothetical protein